MIATNTADLGVMIRRARKQKRLSQQDLAALLGVTRQWVITVEKGAPTVRLDLVLKALRAVDLLVDVVPDESARLIAAAPDDDDG